MNEETTSIVPPSPMHDCTISPFFLNILDLSLPVIKLEPVCGETHTQILCADCHLHVKVW